VLFALLRGFLVFLLGLFLHCGGSFVTFQCAGWRRRPRALQHDIRAAHKGVKENHESRAKNLRQRSAGAGCGVIAFAGADVEAFATDADFNGVVVLGAVVSARVVAERVLIAGLLGDARVQPF